jgi:hypothetical protein
VCCAHLPLDEVILLMPLCYVPDFHLDCNWSLCLDFFFLLLGYALMGEDLLVIREDEQVLR